jgi:hypothetical protein
LARLHGFAGIAMPATRRAELFGWSHTLINASPAVTMPFKFPGVTRIQSALMARFFLRVFCCTPIAGMLAAIPPQPMP